WQAIHFSPTHRHTTAATNRPTDNDQLRERTLFIISTPFSFKALLPRILKHPLDHQLPFTILLLYTFGSLTLSISSIDSLRCCGRASRLLRARHCARARTRTM